MATGKSKLKISNEKLNHRIFEQSFVNVFFGQKLKNLNLLQMNKKELKLVEPHIPWSFEHQ
jgi:hypothetical protein